MQRSDTDSASVPGSGASAGRRELIVMIGEAADRTPGALRAEAQAPSKMERSRSLGRTRLSDNDVAGFVPSSSASEGSAGHVAEKIDHLRDGAARRERRAVDLLERVVEALVVEGDQ